MNQPIGGQSDEKASSPPSPPAELESVLAEYCELVTVNPNFLRSQLLRKATLQWHGRTLRGRTRITNFLRLKQRFGALRSFAFEQPVECPPFDCERNRFGSMSHGDGQEPPSRGGSRRASRARKRSATLTPTKPASPASEADVEVDILGTHDDEVDVLKLTPLLPPHGGQDPLSGVGLLPLDSGESFALGYRTPPRGSDANLPPNPSVYDALRLGGLGRRMVSDSNSSGTSSASSATSTDDDDSMGDRPAGHETTRPIDGSKPEQPLAASEKQVPKGGEDAVEPFGKVRFLRAKSSVPLASPAAGTSTPPECQYRRASIAGSSCDSGPPTHLALSYRMHRTTRRPHFQQIVYHWPSAKVSARRKLFDTVEPETPALPGDGCQDSTGAIPKYEPEKLVPMAAQAMAAQAIAAGTLTPRPSRRASEIVVGLRPLPTSPPPSPRAVRYPYPPSTPVKRRRSVAMHLRTPPPLVGSIASAGSSSSTISSSSSSSSSSTSTSSSSFIAMPFEYGRVCRKQLRADTPPPSASAAIQPPSSGATNIPFHAAGMQGSTAGAGASAGPVPGHLIRLGNTPVLPPPEQGDGRRKPSPTAAAAPAVPARKPPRL
ncbi:serine/arginine repetitive matrix protein 2-like [Anopheles coustani]|uniref:serine/arginine repetitive matrix protein 2-like n=1 Tax=Anopheles coustani TaxID=139045 RepID=UPI00265B4495|nr:serine/arginine repetitive matrix protein 2-like [Anopheles coustani]